MDMQEPGFQITEAKGIHVSYPNGWTISVQWGYGNYCENKYSEECRRSGKPLQMEQLSLACKNAEIAIWCSVPEDVRPLAELGGYRPGWINFGGDEVQGYVGPVTVTRIMAILAGSEGYFEYDEVQDKVREIINDCGGRTP